MLFKRTVGIVLTVIIIICSIIFGTIFINRGQNNNISDDNIVNVTIVTDEAYVMPARTVIRSIARNKKKNTNVKVYVIAVDVSPKGVKKLVSEKRKNVDISIVAFSNEYLGRMNLNGAAFWQKSVVSRADNSKFFLTSLLPDVDKVIYLDCDTIVLKDLSTFYNTDLGTNYIAAVDDWQTGWNDSSDERYFNNGVMLLNLAQMRKDNIDKRLLDEKYKDKNGRFITQDAYNVTMHGKTVFLPLIYNTFAPEYDSINFPDRVQTVLKDNYDSKLYPYLNNKEFRDAVVTIHYCGWDNIKPWWKLDFKRPTNVIWYKFAPLDFWKDCLTGKSCVRPY